MGHPVDLLDRAALHGGRHHRARRLADRAALTGHPQVGQYPVHHVDGDHHLVAAQRVEALGAVGRRGQLTLQARVLVVVEDDLPVEVFQTGHVRSAPRDGVVEDQKNRSSDAGQGVDQGVDVRAVVVQVPRGPGERSGGDIEHSQQRLGAVVAGPHADPGLVEHLGHVVGMDVAVAERHHPAPPAGVGRPVDPQRVAVGFAQAAQGVGGEHPLVAGHGLHAHAVEVVGGRPEADGLGDGRRARLELPGQLGGGEAVQRDVEDHRPAAQERRHGLEQLPAAPQRPDAGRPAHLVGREGDEIGVPGARRRWRGGARTGRRRRRSPRPPGGRRR